MADPRDDELFLCTVTDINRLPIPDEEKKTLSSYLAGITHQRKKRDIEGRTRLGQNAQWCRRLQGQRGRTGDNSSTSRDSCISVLLGDFMGVFEVRCRMVGPLIGFREPCVTVVTKEGGSGGKFDGCSKVWARWRALAR